MKSPCATVAVRFHVVDVWSHRLAWPRTEPSQGLNTGSNPVGTTTFAVLQFLPSMGDDHWVDPQPGHRIPALIRTLLRQGMIVLVNGVPGIGCISHRHMFAFW